MKKVVFCAIATLLLLSSIAAAQRYISIQGRVTNADESPVSSGSYTFLFNITDASGTQYWTETQTLYVDKGLFYAELGRVSGGLDYNNIPSGAGDLFLEVTFNGQKLSPKLNLTSSGHAISASYLLPTNNEIQASIFRDYNNYYNFIDPSSTDYSLNVSGGGYFYGSTTCGVQARIFRDLDSPSSYYVDPSSTSIVNLLRASTFYDRDNTNYYLNPYGVSVLNQTRTNQTNASQFCIPGASPDCITSWPSGGGGGWAVSSPYVYNNTAGVKVGIGTATPINTLNVVGNTNITATTSPALYSKTTGTYAGQFEGKLYSSNDMEAPRFVDSQNTAYYVDPAGDSKINYLEINRGGSGLGHKLTITGDSRYWGWGYWNDTPRIEYAFWNGAGWDWNRMTIGQSSVGIMSYTGDSALEVGGNIDASQMRDRENTAYYIDPAGTSNINALTWIDGSCNSGNAISAISPTGGLTCEPVGGGGNGWAVSSPYVYNDTTGVKVGIGTATPNNKLSVAGDVGIASWLQMSGNILMSGNNVTNIGYVGIGTSSPSEKLDVNGLIKIPLANANRYDSPGIVAASNDDFLYDGEYLNHYGYGFHSYNDGGGVGINAYIAGYFGIDLFTGGTERLRINSNGNVGIGTSSPVAKLQSSGAAQTSSPTLGSATGGALLLTNTDPKYGLLTGVSGNGNVWQQVQRIDGVATAYNLLLQPSGGSVGIGTSSPDTKLDVNGVLEVGSGSRGAQLSSSAGDNFVLKTYTNTPNPNLWIGYGDGSGGQDNSREYISMNANKFMLMNGNVGIGTSSPYSKLQLVSQDSTSGLSFFTSSYDSTKNYGTRIYKSDISGGIPLSIDTQLVGTWYSSVFIDHGQDNNHPSLRTYYNTQLAVTSGNVGIGTTSPTQKLDVAGSATVSGKIYGWNVPSSVTITTTTHNGNFGGYLGMYNWIQTNGCSGYHVCDETEITRWYQTGGTVSGGECWYNTGIKTWMSINDYRDCKGWTDGSIEYGAFWYSSSGLYPNTPSWAQCSATNRVCCCK